MREIKFRAWHEYRKEMVFGPQGKENASWILAMCEANGIQPMQFTGLRDKNGREIYESDIVKHATNPIGCEVVFWGGGFRLGHGNCAHTLLNRVSSCEVIGNIYENPELLK